MESSGPWDDVALTSGIPIPANETLAFGRRLRIIERLSCAYLRTQPLLAVTGARQCGVDAVVFPWWF